jgi:hypothetical protein
MRNENQKNFERKEGRALVFQFKNRSFQLKPENDSAPLYRASTFAKSYGGQIAGQAPFPSFAS